MNLIQAPSVRHYFVFNNAIATGFDKEKCMNGIEDLTRLCDIDNSRPWNKELVACKIIKSDAAESMESLDLAEVDYIRIDKDI